MISSGFSCPTSRIIPSSRKACNMHNHPFHLPFGLLLVYSHRASKCYNLVDNNLILLPTEGGIPYCLCGFALFSMKCWKIGQSCETDNIALLLFKMSCFVSQSLDCLVSADTVFPFYLVPKKPSKSNLICENSELQRANVIQNVHSGVIFLPS